MNVDLAKPFSYGYNREGVRWGSGLGLGEDMEKRVGESRVLNPGEMILLADSDGIASIHFEYIYRFRRVLGPPGDRHRAGANVLFCDGHVSWSKQAELILRSDEVARKWNHDNLPHRELW